MRDFRCNVTFNGDESPDIIADIICARINHECRNGDRLAGLESRISDMGVELRMRLTGDTVRDSGLSAQAPDHYYTTLTREGGSFDWNRVALPPPEPDPEGQPVYHDMLPSTTLEQYYAALGFNGPQIRRPREAQLSAVRDYEIF
jgi:hypothetical protein